MPKSLTLEIVQKLNKLNYRPVFTGARGSELLRINLMFSDSFLSSKIIIKYNTQGNYKLDKQYKVAKGLLYHIHVDDKDLAVYFENLQDDEIKKILTTLKSRESYVFNFSIFPKAHAECSNSLSGVPTVDLDSNIAAEGEAGLLSNCMTGLGSGVEESTVGVVSSIWNGITSEASRLWENPSKRLGDYWGFVSDGAAAVWDFLKVLGNMFINPVYAKNVLAKKFGEIGNFFVNAYNSVKDLPTNQQVELFCNILGSIGVDVLIAAVTVGAASGKLGLTIARLLVKLKKIAGVIGKGIKVPFKVLEKVSGDVLRKLKSFDSVEDKAFINRKLRRLGCGG
jgi:hypothetical protein